MKMKKYLIFTVISLIAIAGLAIGTVDTKKPTGDKIIKRHNCLQGVGFSQGVMNDTHLNLKSPLYGIKEVVVLVEKLPQEAERYGLTRQALQTDTELRLRQYGIKVITSQEKDRRFMEHIRQVATHMKHSKKRIEEDLQAEEKKYAEDMKRIKDDFLQDKDYEKYEESLNQFIRSRDERFWISFIDFIYEDESVKESFKRLIISLYEDDSDEHFEKCVIEYLNCVQEYQDKPYKSPTLYINVLPLIFEEPRVVVANISIEVRTQTYLRMGSSSVLASAVLWKRGFIISRGLDDIGEIRDEVKDSVSEFINDYLAANPEASTPASPSTTKPLQKGGEYTEGTIQLTVSPPTTKPPQKGLIRGIIYSGNSPSALIGDRTVHEGDTIGGVKIVKIYIDKVEFEKKDEAEPIRWMQKVGESPEEHWE